MKKNIILILLIFLVPLCAYFWLTHDRLTTPPTIASGGCEVIKFSSPMCYECQELEKIFEEVFPEYQGNVTLRRIDVTKKDKGTRELIEMYEVKLVPTTVFRKSDGSVTRRIEGAIQPHILRNYLKELKNG